METESRHSDTGHGYITGIKLEVDMIASRINTQFPRYASFRPDPTSEAADSFSISGFGFPFYAFPPFCVIPSMMQKNPQGQGKRCGGTSGLAKSTLVCSSSKNVCKEACSGVCKKLSSVSASTSRGRTSAGKAQVDYLRNIRSRL